MRALLRNFIEDETGATAVEYGLILACLSLTMIAGFGKASEALDFLFGSNESRLRQALNK